jgi:hypothetical protein
VVVADEAIMRFVYYRSDGKGLMLVIFKFFSLSQHLRRWAKVSTLAIFLLCKYRGNWPGKPECWRIKYIAFLKFSESCTRPLQISRKALTKGYRLRCFVNIWENLNSIIQSRATMNAKANQAQSSKRLYLKFSSRLSISESNYQRKSNSDTANSTRSRPTNGTAGAI